MPWDQARRTSADHLHPRKVQRIIAAHGGICYLCGHSGADSVDHLVPWAEWTNPDLSVHDKSNLAPAHLEPCPTCSATCHDDKSKAEAARGRARGHERRKALGRRPAERHPGAL